MCWYTKSKQITNYKLHSNVTRTCNQAAFNSNELKLDVLNHSNPCCLIQGTSTWHAFEAQQRVCESKDVTIRGFSRVSLECAKIFHMPVTFHLKAHMSKSYTQLSTHQLRSGNGVIYMLQSMGLSHSLSFHYTASSYPSLLLLQESVH